MAMQRTGSGDLVQRMKGVARLDESTYEEIERDQNATGQALLVVVLAAVASLVRAACPNDRVDLAVAGVVVWGQPAAS